MLDVLCSIIVISIVISSVVFVISVLIVDGRQDDIEHIKGDDINDRSS